MRERTVRPSPRFLVCVTIWIKEYRHSLWQEVAEESMFCAFLVLSVKLRVRTSSSLSLLGGPTQGWLLAVLSSVGVQLRRGGLQARTEERLAHGSLVKDLKKAIFSLIQIDVRSVEWLGILWVRMRMKDKWSFSTCSK